MLSANKQDVTSDVIRRVLKRISENKQRSDKGAKGLLWWGAVEVLWTL